MEKRGVPQKVAQAFDQQVLSLLYLPIKTNLFAADPIKKLLFLALYITGKFAFKFPDLLNQVQQPVVHDDP